MALLTEGTNGRCAMSVSGSFITALYIKMYTIFNKKGFFKWENRAIVA